MPSQCQVGQMFFNTSAAGGANIFACSSQNTWSVVGNSYTLPQATATILGGVIVPGASGLSVSGGGALSVIWGSAPNTAAQGNDSRITGALQAVNNLSDLSNPTTAVQNLRLTGTNPLLISAPTAGNAGTATRLAATPTACTSGQYATGINASGNASCAQIQYSQISGTPSSYNLPAATNSTLGGVMIGSGLTVSSGMLSANVGTGPGTLAAGNDLRLAGAVQAVNNLSDLSNPTTALQNLKLTGTNPLLISAPTAGNAGTATRLAATPTACTSGQYATGINASGNASCAQIQYSQINGTPSSYNLPAATNSTLGGVMIGSGLAVSSGMLSANVGTGPGTLAAGNDVRLAGALQAFNNLSELSNPTTALQNLKLTGTNPATIASSTTGNANTANSLHGSGALQILGGTGSPPALDPGQTGCWYSSLDSAFRCADTASHQWAMIDNVTPSSSSAPCTPPEAAYDGTYIYVCTAINTWKRTPALSTF